LSKIKCLLVDQNRFFNFEALLEKSDLRTQDTPLPIALAVATVQPQT